jgi:hypothetical protein
MAVDRTLKLDRRWRATWPIWEKAYNNIGPRPKLTPEMLEDEWATSNGHIEYVA